MKTKSFLRSIALTALTGTAMALSTFVGAASFAPATLPDSAAAHYVPGEVLVKFKPTVAAQATTGDRGGHVQHHPSRAETQLDARQARRRRTLQGRLFVHSRAFRKA